MPDQDSRDLYCISVPAESATRISMAICTRRSASERAGESWGSKPQTSSRTDSPTPQNQTTFPDSYSIHLVIHLENLAAYSSLTSCNIRSQDGSKSNTERPNCQTYSRRWSSQSQSSRRSSVRKQRCQKH